MKNKCRTLFLTLAVVLCMTAFSVTAFAAEAGHYASDESGTATPPDAIERITVDTDAVTSRKQRLEILLCFLRITGAVIFQEGCLLVAAHL